MDHSAKTIPIACDHGGYEMKEYIKAKLILRGWNVLDYGTDSPDSVDYPDLIHPLARDVNEAKYPMGIVICGSGNGAQMVANKYPNIRAALCWNKDISRLARQHNDANILSLPGRYISFELAMEITEIFLSTAFEGSRHEARVKKISRS